MKKRRRWWQCGRHPSKLLLFLLLLAAASSASSVDGKMGRIHSHLKRINKPPLRTIQSPDGDSIDCVAREQQHALDHPLLKKHKIQLKPTSFPMASDVNGSGSGSGSGGRRAWQTWHHAGHCPKGTVPVRRTNADDVLRVGKPLSRFGRKHHKHRQRAPRAANAPDVVTGNGHEVSPALYGDSRPRLFTYWTSDAYEATGCYNALCPGFIQTSPHIAIGASISPVSSVSGDQYDMTLLVWKDPRLGNWWLSYGGQLVGYWPAALFTHLGSGGHASMVEWGGEVVNTSPGGAHTATQMGSGRFASQGFGKASYFRNLETVDAGNSLVPVPVDALQTLAEDAGCYDIRKAFDDDGRQGWGTHFYYGGPGHNPACP